MTNEILRYYSDDNIIIYYRFGKLKDFTPLSRYFVYDIKNQSATGKEFKSRISVRKYIKSLRTGILL